jgi:hypothetical protein
MLASFLRVGLSTKQPYSKLLYSFLVSYFHALDTAGLIFHANTTRAVRGDGYYVYGVDFALCNSIRIEFIRFSSLNGASLAFWIMIRE